MQERALPPVLVLISDGQPTDDFEGGLRVLMAEPWGMKAVRLAVAIGGELDEGVVLGEVAQLQAQVLLVEPEQAAGEARHLPQRLALRLLLAKAWCRAHSLKSSPR